LPLLPISHVWRYAHVPQSREIHGRLFSRFENILSSLLTLNKNLRLERVGSRYMLDLLFVGNVNVPGRSYVYEMRSTT
jgi:hypothetical protein